MPTIVSRFVLRAPLLPAARLADPRALERDEALRALVDAASPELAAAGGRAEARAARLRYLRRAAFRPTPQGPWAGVAVGELGARTAIATGATRLHARPSWRALAALGRELLADPQWRERARLRRAPSLLGRGERALWLAPPHDGGVAGEARVAELDELLAAVLAASEDWAPWAEVRDALAGAPGDPDDYLFALLDDGLLVHDLAPPLVGPPPDVWMRERLGDEGGRVDALPAEHVVLVHTPARPPLLARAAVERAAAVAPVLFRLQEALAPPAAERALDARIPEALEAVREPLGEGALELAALALGDYGTPLVEPGSEPPAAEPAAIPPALLALLVERLVKALAGDEAEARFTAAELDAVLEPAAPPPSFELVLAPRREPRGAAPGTGWQLGLHAPAGASWGRFAEALGAALGDALAELAAAERDARPGEARVDVAFAPAPALADLAAHPPVREATLALSSWPDGVALAPADLALVYDPAAGVALRGPGGPVAPSPLGRLRSSLAPAGVYQLLAGWSLVRQHAPWALHLGPLARLARLPRVVVDGFVVMPASWTLPAGRTARSLAAWRKAHGVPRWVQSGHEDELLPVDLDARDAAATLERLARDTGAPGDARVWEIWPPLGDEVDAGGRRVEAVVAVVSDAEPAEQAAIAHAAAAGVVPAPRAAPGWRTYTLWGARDRADRVLLGAVGPAVADALAAREIDRWFFLRYAEGARAQLRVRAHTAGDAAQARFERRLRAALEPARDAGDVIRVDAGDWLHEPARWGGAAPAVERWFHADSELALALIEREPDGEHDRVELLVIAMDALGAGIGLGVPARRELAGRRRDAHGVARGPGDPFASAYRAVARRLTAALTAPPPPARAYRERVRPLAPHLPAALLPALLHLQAARLVGDDAEAEALACYLWERACESLAVRSGKSPNR